MRGERFRFMSLMAKLHRARRARRALALILIATFSLQSMSCGTLLHPGRVGQPRTGPLDPNIVVLDGLGVILFVVPGLVAFVVDFATGAIYLPGPGYYPAPYPPPRYPPPGYAPPGAYSPSGPYPAPGPAESPPPAPGSSALTPPPPPTPVPMTRIDVDPALLNKQKIEAIVRAQTGQDIDLDASNVHAERVQNVDEASRMLVDVPAQ